MEKRKKRAMISASSFCGVRQTVIHMDPLTIKRDSRKHAQQRLECFSTNLGLARFNHTTATTAIDTGGGGGGGGGMFIIVGDEDGRERDD